MKRNSMQILIKFSLLIFFFIFKMISVNAMLDGESKPSENKNKKSDDKTLVLVLKKACIREHYDSDKSDDSEEARVDEKHKELDDACDEEEEEDIDAGIYLSKEQLAKRLRAMSNDSQSTSFTYRVANDESFKEFQVQREGLKKLLAGEWKILLLFPEKVGHVVTNRIHLLNPQSLNFYRDYSCISGVLIEAIIRFLLEFYEKCSTLTDEEKLTLKAQFISTLIPFLRAHVEKMQKCCEQIAAIQGKQASAGTLTENWLQRSINQLISPGGQDKSFDISEEYGEEFCDRFIETVSDSSKDFVKKLKKAQEKHHKQHVDMPTKLMRTFQLLILGL
jgi:hypothetical protein